MTPRIAAAVWLATHAALKTLEREHDAAAEVLKTHFRITSKTTFGGVAYSRSSFTRLSVAKARTLLGPVRAKECEVDTPRETLTPAG